MIKIMIKLDKKDLKILTALDINARQSNSQIGKKVGLSKEVVKYRIDRMQDNGVILRFHTVVNYFRLGIVKFKLYLKLTNASKEKLEEIAQYFKSHKNTEWVALCTGRWDLIVGFLVKNVNEFDDEVQEAVSKFSAYIKEKDVTTTLYLVHQAREFLQQNKKEVLKVIYHTSKDAQEKIDNIDEEIIKVLANNARMPVTEIAKRLKVTARIVQYRIKELERKKILLAYKAHLDPRQMGRVFCKSFVYLANTTEKELKSFISYASSIPGAVWPQRVMGSWDFEIDLELESYDAFQDVILEMKEKFSEIIKNEEFIIVSKEFKLDLFPGCYEAIK